MFLIAQTDPISGGAGWVGAGLLGMVLAWLLLKYLPEQATRQERQVAAHETILAAALSAQRADFLSALTQERGDFAGALERIMRQHEIQIQHLADAVNKDMQLTRQMIQELRGTDARRT